MATFYVGVHLHAFESMERGDKTVYVLAGTEEYQLICSGDRVEFGAVGAITVGFVRRYVSLEALLDGESWTNVQPNAGSAELAASEIRSSAEWDEGAERSAGVLALRVRDALRK